VVAYVLKTDDDDVLLDAVARAMALVEREVEQRALMENAAAVFESAGPVLKHDFLLNLLRGQIGRDTIESADEPPLRLAIDPGRPVKLLLCFMGKERGCGADYSGRMKRLFAADEALVAALRPNFAFEHTMPGENNWAWLVQKRGGAWDAEADTMIRLALEQAQMRLFRGAGVKLSVILGEKSVPLEGVSSYWAELCPLVGYSADHWFEILSERDIACDAPLPLRHMAEYEPVQQKAAALQCLLEKGERDSFLVLLSEILAPAAFRQDHADTVAAEIFMTVSSVFLSYLNKTGLADRLSRFTSVYELTHFDAGKSRAALLAYFESVAGFLFDQQHEHRETRANQAVAIARDYILRNISKDLSLVTLADKVYLNPSYFSALFKARVGMNVSQFIRQERLRLAKQYLAESKYRINRISAMLGFSAPAYFTRFFKAEMRMSPQEYRDGILLEKGAADERE
jgi:two-component system response regulator YesN